MSVEGPINTSVRTFTWLKFEQDKGLLIVISYIYIFINEN